MKRILQVALFSVAIVALLVAAQLWQSGAFDPHRAQREAATRFIEAYNKGDREGLAALFAPSLRGDLPDAPAGKPPIQVSLDKIGIASDGDGRATAIGNLKVGEKFWGLFFLEAPDEYEVYFSLIQEGGAWYVESYQTGGEMKGYDEALRGELLP